MAGRTEVIVTLQGSSPGRQRAAPIRTLVRRPIRRDDRLIRARSLASSILATHADSLPHAVIGATRLTSTGLAIATVRRIGESPRAVIKLAMTPGARRGLARETIALAALRGDDRLGGWRELLPRQLARGSVGGHSYRVDSILAGQPAEYVTVSTARRRMLHMAAEAADVLHRATAATVGSNVGDLWVDVHLRELARHGPLRRSLVSRLELLREELHDALSAQAFPACRIHGDYWLGNVIWRGVGSARTAPVGIIDWEASAPLELPCHDMLHLLLYTRRQVTGRELGLVIRDQLRGAEWAEDERVFLDRFGVWDRCGSLSQRHCLLLYWLRHVSAHTRQQSPPVGYRYRVWEQRNIVPVLASL
jgi:Phosphotransferase enzyme family